MNEQDWLAQRFEEHRTHLRAVAYRMLGSRPAAEDALQETWLRLSRSDSSGVENLAAWLTTIVARVCLNMLSSTRSRPEQLAGTHPPASTAGHDETADPEYQALLADSVGLALLAVLDSLTPAERLAYVLHDMFDVPFAEIAPIVDRSPAAARQLASRARRRVRGAGTASHHNPSLQRELVTAFLAASRGGKFDALVTLLDLDVVLQADAAAVRLGAPHELRGAAAIANGFMGRFRGAQPAVVHGEAGAAWAPGGRTRVAFAFTTTHGRIARIELIADPERLHDVNLVI